MPVEPANLPVFYSACNIATEFVHQSNGHTINGSATGFFARRASGKLALVSNRHALEIGYFDPKHVDYNLVTIIVTLFLRNTSGALGVPEAVDVSVASPLVMTHTDATVDLACVAVDRSELIGGRSNADVYSIGESSFGNKTHFDSQIDVGEIVFFSGFPEWHDKSEFRPILRYGRIVSDPRRDYRQQEGAPQRFDGRQQLAIEAFSFSGNSGSPVFLEKHGNVSLQAGLASKINMFYRPQLVVGINAGHLTASPGMPHAGHHSGLSYVYKSTAILEILQRIK